VHLVITAIPGPGNLLGNLLRAIANLLDPTGGLTDLLQFLNLLNQSWDYSADLVTPPVN